jgi:RecA-family ATPase
VGGEPKCCKSFLALDIAVAVASGTPCLRRFPTVRRGRVLLFAAEDSLTVVRQRLAGIAAATNTPLDALDIHVIIAPVVRVGVRAAKDAPKPDPRCSIVWSGVTVEPRTNAN